MAKLEKQQYFLFVTHKHYIIYPKQQAHVFTVFPALNQIKTAVIIIALQA